MAEFLAGRSEKTIEAYRWDLNTFAVFLKMGDPVEALQSLLSLDPGAANEVVLSWRNHLVKQKLSPATINRRLSAIRSVVKLARVLGHITWTLEIPNEKSKAYRDTRGPAHEEILRLMGQEM